MKKWLVIALLGLAQFVMVLDSTVMNVSISTVAEDLNTTIFGMQAAITFYALTMASLMLTGGKLGDIFGRLKAFRIGSIIYGIGSLITAIAPNLGVLLFGWSLVEGIGAIMVIPAILALAAVNYTGKDRVVAFSILGAITGLAAAAGPLIGGFMTTYLSWRYVFAAETVVMIFVLIFAGKIKDIPIKNKPKLDLPSVFLSAFGMSLLVFGVLQSKTWGWINPLATPEINGVAIAPFGISLVVYLIIAGLLVLRMFVKRQQKREAAGEDVLLKVSLLKIPALRSSLSVLLSQYFTIAALFFVVPVYLQTILGYDALQTGVKLLPLSVGLVVFSMVGSKLSKTMPAKVIVRRGQLIMALGVFFVMAAVKPDLGGVLFALGMFIVGVGFGLLASQLGNVSMSAVDKSDTAEVGGLQGTFQNLGSSFGTALVGSVFILSLTSGFTNSIQASPSLSAEAKNAVVEQSQTGVGIVSNEQAEQYVIENGGTASTASTIASIYTESQLKSLKLGLFFVVIVGLLATLLSKDLPLLAETKKK